LNDASGHRFGFELTFFREAVNRDATEENDSPWSVRDLYIAHLALSDISGQRFYQRERVSRGGPGLAGISESDGRIWNGNWQVRWQSSGQELTAISESFSIQLSARTNKAPVVHGVHGFSQKAAGEGHASHYISLTRLLTAGSIDLNGTHYKVEGSSWMDHEFFTQQLAPSEAGWDWTSIQFSDNTELMLYRLRHKDGTVDPFSSGTYVDAQGETTHLSQSDFTMEPTGQIWTSPDTKAKYPIAWRIFVPALHLEFSVSSPLQTQEIVSRGQGTPSYWEGAIDVTGHRGESPIDGAGYLEMTGYAGDVQF
jgi:predicted secreted hydrolase